MVSQLHIRVVTAMTLLISAINAMPCGHKSINGFIGIQLLLFFHTHTHTHTHNILCIPYRTGNDFS
jgi:hypothetical protein